MKIQFQSKHIPLGTYDIAARGRYPDGSLSIGIFNPKTGETEAVVTVAVPDVLPQPGNVMIKSWSECEGVYAGLITAEIIGPVLGTHQCGHADAFECPLTDLGKKLLEDLE